MRRAFSLLTKISANALPASWQMQASSGSIGCARLADPLRHGNTAFGDFPARALCGIPVTRLGHTGPASTEVQLRHPARHDPQSVTPSWIF
jgi:hypothetical protein